MSLASALRSRDVAELPSRRDENWRWSDLRGLLRVLPPASPQVAPPQSPGPFAAAADASVAIVNGRPCTSVGVLKVPEHGARTVALRFISASAETSHGASVQIDVGAGGSLTLLESHEGQAAGYVADAELDIVLGQGARMERIVLADDDAGAVSVSIAQVSLGAGASYGQTVLTGGARRQRIETRVVHPGEHAQLRLDGAYLLARARHADLTSVVTHAGVDGTTSQLAKGVVRDQARGVFQGRIVVTQGADRTDAKMGHHALILSDRAEVDAKPELEIFADDVSCAHGNTVGALDEDALFYARQRGMPEALARTLLTQAFVGEVIDRIEHQGAREVARAWVAARLEG